jgi:hypothetical protein
MSFFTREDDLRFRRTTWLLNLLKGREESGGDRGEFPRKGTHLPVVFRELTSLATIFVRNYEVVAVIPRVDGVRYELYVQAGTEENLKTG